MLNPTFAKWLFFLVEDLRGEHVKQYLEELEKTQWYTPAELKALQWEKLKNLLVHAYQNVPWYNHKFREKKLTPKDISKPKDLKLLPVLTKSDLRDNASFLRAQNYKAKVTIAKTSGSTGISIKFPKDRKSSGYGRAVMYRGHRWHGVDAGDKEAKLYWVSMGLKGRMVQSFGDYFLNRFRQTHFKLTETVMIDFYRKMKKNKPQYIMGYPSMIYECAYYLKENNLIEQFDLKMIKVTAETLFDYQKELIESVFGCSVVNEYGAAEVGLMGFECPKHNIHVLSECVFVEESDDTSLEGKHEFIVTDLNNFAFPIIRYKLGDSGKLSEKICSCGRGHQLLETVQGRISDIVYKADGTPVHSSLFSYILKELTKLEAGIKQYKVYQHSLGHLWIEIVKDSHFTKDSELMLEEIIRKTFDQDTRMEIDFVNEITRDKSGKLRYFESKITSTSDKSSSADKK